MALHNKYRAHYSRCVDNQRIAGKERTEMAASSSSSPPSIEEQSEAEYIEHARQVFLKKQADKAKLKELLARVFGVVVGVGRRGVDGLPLDMKEEDYMKKHFDDDAKDAVVQYDGASSIVLSPVASARQLGGVSAVYTADTPTAEFNASLLVSEKHPFGVIAVFDFDVMAAAQKTARRLRPDYEEVMEQIKQTMLGNEAPGIDAYFPDAPGLTQDAGRWPTFFPQHSSVGLHLRTGGGISIVVKVNVGSEGMVTLDRIMSEEGMTFGQLAVDPRYLRLERLVERNAKRLAYEIAERLWGYDKTPFDDDTLSCLKDYHCYYPLARPSILMHTNCIRRDATGRNVVIFVDAANRMTTRSTSGFFLGFDKDSHRHSLVPIPDDDSLFVLHAKKLPHDERKTRNTDDQEAREQMFKYAYSRSANVHIKRKYVIPSDVPVYENIISIKK